MELKCVLDHLRSVLEHKTCLENTLGSHQESKTSDMHQDYESSYAVTPNKEIATKTFC